ncbi:RNA-directed DNA polymerase from mobile element jockey [Trichonephila clavipes]|nr:RNA-directed DNA polymerase from mobile element jockey [Trichonephila clavipes]
MGTVEATSVTLTPPGGDPLVITSLYISPSVSYQHIHTDVEALFRLGSASIICGDFNAHHISWGCQRNDNRGNIIKNLIDNTDTQIVAPTTPTRFCHNSASIIDFALTRNIHWLSQVESIAELSSDHNPLIISFDTNRRFAFPKRKLDLTGASEMNRLYPNSRRESSNENQYLNTLPRRGEDGGRNGQTKTRQNWYEKENGDCKTELAAGTMWNLKQEPALITDPISDVGKCI